VEAAGLRGIHEFQRGGHAVRSYAFPVQVDSHVRNERFPLQLNELLRVVEGAGGRVHDVSMDAAVFARNVRRLSEFDEVVLAGEALPAFRDDPRRIDAAGRQVVRAAGRRIAGAGAIGNGLIGAVRVLAIYGAGHTEVEGQRNLFDGVREVLGDVGIA